MADDTELNLGSGGDVIATDDIGPGVKYQRVKVTLGADGVNDGDVSATNPIPTELKEINGVAVAAAQTDDNSIPGALVHQAMIGFLYGWDGTSAWERLETDASGHLRIVCAGTAGYDSPIQGFPVLVGSGARDSEPARVSADDDTVGFWLDRWGRMVTVSGHPTPEDPVVVNATGAGDTTVIAAPGASLSLYISRVVINNGGAAVNAVQLQELGSAVNRGGGDLAADGGGMVLDFGDRGWKLTANTALQVNLGSAGDVWVSVLNYYIAA